MIPQSQGQYARPYRDHYNTESIYKNIGYSVAESGQELTDDQIAYLTESEIEMYCSRGDSVFSVNTHDELYGDDYADAILADLYN